MISANDYSLITDFLADYYDAELFTRHGVSHPVIQHEPLPAQRDDVDSILGRLTPTPPKSPIDDASDFAFYNYAYLHTLQNSGRNLFNGTTYILRLLRTQGNLRIDAEVGQYFDMIATCIALERELLDVIQAGAIRFPMRSQYHRAVEAQSSLTRGNGRSAALGGVVLIVFKDGTQGYKGLVAERSAKNATRTGALHLIPAFIFQPQSIDTAKTDWSFKYHIYREYLEELVGMPEDNPAGMESQPALQDLRRMEANGTAQVQLTGVSMNLLTLRAEISAVLVIHDADWWADLQTGKRGYQLETPESAGKLLEIPIANDELALSALPNDYYLRMVPQAIPALWRGIDAARRLIGE
ncbi:MAG: hypothetical protein AAFR81_28510 [Chloroflexota bacterium]